MISPLSGPGSIPQPLRAPMGEFIDGASSTGSGNVTELTKKTKINVKR